VLMSKHLFYLILMLVGGILVVGTGLGQYVEDSVDVGGAWVGGMVYNSRADVVYGNCQYTNGIFFAISCSTNQVIARFNMPWPREAAYDSIDNKTYVAFQSGDEDSVLVVDGVTHSRLRAIPLDWAIYPVWDPVSNRLYVSCGENNSVGVIDCRTDSVICHIPVGAYPLKMHLNTRHHKLYVQNYDEGSVSIVDLQTNQVIRTIPLGSEPQSGYYCEWAEKYYCGTSDRVHVVDDIADTVTTRIDLPGGSWSMSANRSQELLFAGIEDGVSYHALYTIDTKSDSVVSVLPIRRGPQELWWSSVTDRLYCANYDGWVTVIAGDGTHILGTMPVNSSPFVFACSPVHQRLYVGHLNCSKVYVIRDTASAICETGPAPGHRSETLRALPNPFVRSVTIRFKNMRSGANSIGVYSAAGVLVRQLAVGTNDIAFGQVEWNGKDENGWAVPAGTYVIVAGRQRTAVVKAK